MSGEIIIVGTGAQAKYAMEIFHLREMSVAGIIALPNETRRKSIDGAEVIGALEQFEDIYHKYKEPRLLLASSSNIVKEDLEKKLSYLQPSYVNALHPTAVIARTAVVGCGVIMNPNAVVQPFARVGNHVMIHAGVVIEHDCVIEDFVNLAPRVAVAGYVKIGKCSTLYTAAVIIPTIEVGQYSTIGAGAVVLKKVGDHSTAVGVPARIIKAESKKKMATFLESLKEQVYVIAEIGCNHNGDLAIARELVRVASESRANAAKFQSFNPEEMITESAPKALYQVKATGTKESQFQRLTRLKLSREEHKELQQLCVDYGIVFCSSPFDHKSVEMLEELQVPFYKIPSGEITNLPLLQKIGAYGKPVLLSTGMSTLAEIETALDAIGREHRTNVILMHCTSDYPARWEDANLRAIKTLREAFHLAVGFSDHTEGIELPLIAVALGAVVIEKHITLSRNMEGGDHKASLEPHEFRDLVAKIRRLEKAMGDGIKKCMPSEENVKTVARKSIVAGRAIMKGETIAAQDLVIKRPGTGISPAFLGKIIGARAREDLLTGQPLKWSQIDVSDK